jgi:glycosyltransferase involved in cell wall biosynthesis
VGIRFIEMANVLRDDGHEVALLSRDGGAVEGVRSGAYTPQTLEDLSKESDAAVVQGHVANDFFAHARPLPTVVDLYDPFIIENLHYYSSRGAEVFTHDHATLTNSLLRGDFFLCASEAQRLFYLGALLVAGRVNPMLYESDARLESLLAIAPFGVQKPRVPSPAEAGASPNALLFGGIYDWYDPVLAIDATAIVRRTIPDASITFMSHPNAALTPQGAAAEASSHIERRGYGSFVHFLPWVPYADRGRLFDRFAAAIMTFTPSIETDLAMRTRLYDFLWGGLPIVSSPAPGTDDIIRGHDAGLIVGEPNAEAFAEAVVEVLRDRQRFTRATREFVEANQWPRVLEPLREFCRSPRFDMTKEAFAARPQLPDRTSILDRIKRRIGGGAS